MFVSRTVVQWLALLHHSKNVSLHDSNSSICELACSLCACLGSLGTLTSSIKHIQCSVIDDSKFPVGGNVKPGEKKAR